MTVFQAIIALGRASWQVLRRHPRLCWFPVLSMIAVISVFLILGPLLATDDDQAVPWLALFVAATIGHLVHVFFDVALTNEALKALRGESPSISSGLDAAVSRAPAIVAFAAVTAPIWFVLGMMGTSSRVGDPVRAQDPRHGVVARDVLRRARDGPGTPRRHPEPAALRRAVPAHVG